MPKKKNPEIETETKSEPLIAYKGFSKDLRCRCFQYEVGKEYHHEGNVVACRSGFHACPEPLEVFEFYEPGTSRYCEVAVSGEIVTKNNKVACENIGLHKSSATCHLP